MSEFQTVYYTNTLTLTLSFCILAIYIQHKMNSIFSKEIPRNYHKISTQVYHITCAANQVFRLSPGDVSQLSKWLNLSEKAYVLQPSKYVGGFENALLPAFV